MPTEDIVAQLKAIGLEAYKTAMAEAGKSSKGVGDAAKAGAKTTQEAGTTAAGGMGKIAAGAAAAAGAMVVAKKSFGFMQGAANDAAGLAKQTAGLQRITGADAKTASAWVSMAKERGIESKALNKGFLGLSKQMSAAAAGSKGAAEGFQTLGLDAQVLMALPMDLRMGMIADSFKALPDGADKAAAASKLFGKQAQTLLPMLNSGAKGLNEQSAMMTKYGLTMDQAGVKKALELSKAQREMRASMDGVKMSIGQALLPVMVDLTKKIAPVVKAFTELIQKCPALIPIVLGLAAAFASMMVISSVVGVVQGFIAVLPLLAAGIKAVWLATTGPVGLVIAAVLAVIAIFVVLYNKVGWFHNAVDAMWNAVVAGAQAAWNWIKGNWPLLLGVLTGPFGLAAAYVITHWNQVVAFFSSLPGKIGAAFNSVKTTILNTLSSIPGQAMNIGRQIVDAIANGIKSAGGVIMDAIESIMPGPLKKAVGGAAGLFSKLPGMALGGIVGAQGGMAVGASRSVLVGERGPEVASFPGGTRITPMPPPMLSPSQLMGGAGGPIICQVFLDRRMIAEAVADYTGEQQAAR